MNWIIEQIKARIRAEDREHRLRMETAVRLERERIKAIFGWAITIGCAVAIIIIIAGFCA